MSIFRRSGFWHGGVVGLLLTILHVSLFGLPLASHAGVGKTDNSVDPPDFDLRTLPDPGASLSCYIPLYQWRGLVSTWFVDSPQAKKLKERSLPYLDPRAEPFLASDLLERSDEFALSIWPDLEVGGDSRPVWLMGFKLENPTAAEEALNFLLDSLDTGVGPPIERPLSGFVVHTIDTIGKDLHLVSAGPVLLISSNLTGLLSYLSMETESALPLPPVEVPAVVTWNLMASADRTMGGEWTPARELLRNLGVAVVRCSCDLLKPGYRFRIAFEGDMGLPPPPKQLDFDLGMIDFVPENPDLIFLGGGIPNDPIRFSDQFPELPNLPGSGLNQPFAFGVEIPQGTDAVRQEVRVAGAYRKKPPPIPPELVPDNLRPATDEALSKPNRAMKVGNLELALVDRGERTVFRNTQRLNPEPSVLHHLESLLPAEEVDILPTFVGVLSPNLLARPLDLEWETFQNSEGAPLLELWPLLRRFIQPVDFLVFVGKGGGVEIELRSQSFFSPILALLQANTLVTLIGKGEESSLNRWLGEFGPLPSPETPGR
ncbi:MAG: hypothetical protein KC964_07865 [Candidatus Omnitrophica bacterium]|nr:hypothetical protein [Candidatus Omnitrophota bacterium]